MRKLRVIIADDEPMIIEKYRQIVSKRDDFEIIGLASNGDEEKKLIFELNPDVVITDNQMPILNGIDVIEQINNSDLVYKPKFIIITGDARNLEFLNKCEKEKVTNVLRKPCPYDMLDSILTDIRIIIEEESI